MSSNTRQPTLPDWPLVQRMISAAVASGTHAPPEPWAKEKPEEKKPIYVGPPAPAGSVCPCGIAALYQCRCGATLCTSHWWKHSHAMVLPGDVVSARVDGGDVEGVRHG